MTFSSPYLRASFAWPPWLKTAVAFCAPPGALAAAGAVFWANLRAGDAFFGVFPWSLAAVAIIYAAGGPFWAAVLGAGASLGALGTVFYATAPLRQFFILADVLVLWACFWQLLQMDLAGRAGADRLEERLELLGLEVSRIEKETAELVREGAAAHERIAAYNRLRFFADDLIGAYGREELSHRAARGLESLLPRARAEIVLFPPSGEPAEEDAAGRRAAGLDGARLFEDASHRRLARGVGRAILAPLRVRDALIGRASLTAAGGAFDVQDLRLASIAADLAAMALGNAERYAKIESMAVSDGLTGVYTRGYLDERLQEEFAKARHHGRSFSLLIVDIDRFKAVNDTHGHRLGDEVLRWLARQITAQCRDTDFVARYGGEEFVVLMPDTPGPSARAFAARLAKAVESTPFRWESVDLKVTVSGGVASLDDRSADEKDLLRRADRALYRAKETGRNRICSDE